MRNHEKIHKLQRKEKLHIKKTKRRRKIVKKEIPDNLILKLLKITSRKTKKSLKVEMKFPK